MANFVANFVANFGANFGANFVPLFVATIFVAMWARRAFCGSLWGSFFLKCKRCPGGPLCTPSVGSRANGPRAHGLRPFPVGPRAPGPGPGPRAQAPGPWPLAPGPLR